MIANIIIGILTVFVILAFIYTWRLHVVMDNYIENLKVLHASHNQQITDQNNINRSLWTYVKMEKSKSTQSIKELQKFILRISKGDRKVVKNEIEKIVKDAKDEETNR